MSLEDPYRSFFLGTNKQRLLDFPEFIPPGFYTT